MKHIKTFESYNGQNIEPVNEEFIGKFLKMVIATPIALIILQFLDPRKVKDMILPQLLDIYGNIDVLIDTLENIHFNKSDITDVEAKKILDKINSLKKVKKKYPTLEDYKKAVCKWAPFLNFKNRNYLKSEIMRYEPKKMDAHQVIQEIKKVYSLVKRDDIIGEVAPGGLTLREDLDEMLRRLRER